MAYEDNPFHHVPPIGPDLRTPFNRVPVFSTMGRGPRGEQGERGFPGEASRKDFETVADMVAEGSLEAGDICRTLGFHEAGDGGAAWYQVTDDATANGMDVIALDNGMYAVLAVGYMPLSPKQLGAYGDNVSDDHDQLVRAFSLSKVVLLDGVFRSESDINVTDVAQRTIYGLGIVNSQIVLSSGAKIVFGSSSNVNELRMSNFAFVGDRTQDTVVKIKYVTNLYLNEVSFSEASSSGYLLELDHADIVFIDKCIFAGSNNREVWRNGNGIKVTHGEPIHITHCNIWNLKSAVEFLDDVIQLDIRENWIEFVETVVNGHDCDGSQLFINIENNCYSNYSYDDGSVLGNRLVKLKDLSVGFDIMINVKNNNIVFYSSKPTQGIIELDNIPSTVNIGFLDNILFTRLSTMNAYALIVDAANDTHMLYKSTTNADINYGCATNGVVNEIIGPKNHIMKDLNIYHDSKSVFAEGDVWFNSGFIRVYTSDNVARVIPTSQGATITNVDPSTVVLSDLASKLNALMNLLRATHIIS